MAGYEWTRDDRGVDTYSKDYVCENCESPLDDVEDAGHRCLADENSCVDGKACPDYVTRCNCRECHVPFDAGDKHNFEWVMRNFSELSETFPEVGIPKSVRHCCYCQLAEWACPKHSDYKE